MLSANLTFCSTKRIDIPSLTTFLNIFIKSFTTRGDNPKNGSSTIKSFGSHIKPLAIASICCSPPDIV